MTHVHSAARAAPLGGCQWHGAAPSKNSCRYYAAWYGGTGRHSGRELTPFSAERSAKFVVRSQVEMNSWIEKHGADVGLSGTVHNLGVQDTDGAVDGDLVSDSDDDDDESDGDDVAQEVEDG